MPLTSNRPRRNTQRACMIGIAAVLTGLVPISSRCHAGVRHLFGRDRGAALDPGQSPHHGPYDAPIPGVRPPGSPDDTGGLAGAHAYPRHVITGLGRYPSLGGYLPAPPYQDCLYPTGPHPWQR